MGSWRSLASIAAAALAAGCSALPGREPMVMVLDSGARLTGGIEARVADGRFRAAGDGVTCTGRVVAASHPAPGSYAIACSDGSRGQGPLEALGPWGGQATLALDGGARARFRYGTLVR